MSAKKTKQRIRSGKKTVKTVLIIAAAAILLYLICLTVIPIIILSGTIHRHYDFEPSLYENVMEDDGQAPRGSAERNGGKYVRHTLTSENMPKFMIYERIPENPDAVMVFVSGMKGPSALEYENFGNVMVERKIGAVLLELPGYGESEGDRIEFGYADVVAELAAYHWCRTEGQIPEDVPVIICGVSMGASSSLVASAMYYYDMDTTFDGVIAMSPYVTFEEQFMMQAKRYGCPPLSRKYAGWVVKQYLGKLYARSAVETCTPRYYAEEIGPTLLISASNDPSVSSANSGILEILLPDCTHKIRDSKDHLIVKGNQLSNVSEDEELLNWIFEWLEDRILPGNALEPAA